MMIDEARPPMALEEYRAVKYSIRDLGNGRWRWALHRRRSEAGGVFREITSGEVSGTREDAFAALKRTVDVAVGGRPMDDLAGCGGAKPLRFGIGRRDGGGPSRVL
jgi:hypothetical protein